MTWPQKLGVEPEETYPPAGTKVQLVENLMGITITLEEGHTYSQGEIDESMQLSQAKGTIAVSRGDGMFDFPDGDELRLDPQSYQIL